MTVKSIKIHEANYVILTRSQFDTDYPDVKLPDGLATQERALVFHDDQDNLIAAFWGFPNDFATLTADMAKYAASSANPGRVEPKVGRNTTVVEKR